MKRTACLLGLPLFVALAIGLGWRWAGRRLERESFDKEIAQDRKRSFWLAGALNEDESWSEASR